MVANGFEQVEMTDPKKALEKAGAQTDIVSPEKGRVRGWQRTKSLDTENKCFILNVDKETLRRAPGFDKDNWPDMTSPEFGTRIYSFYKVTPYWE